MSTAADASLEIRLAVDRILDHAAAANRYAAQAGTDLPQQTAALLVQEALADVEAAAMVIDAALVAVLPPVSAAVPAVLTKHQREWALAMARHALNVSPPRVCALISVPTEAGDMSALATMEWGGGVTVRVRATGEEVARSEPGNPDRLLIRPEGKQAMVSASRRPSGGGLE
ncbi:hypothetical protein [Ideonella sp.]|uniref:hypothetical protein n=1 Tax=Ideonella sp. TaxID=1929293 RepID=UPI0035B33A30